MEHYIGIPRRFKLFGSTINVEFDNKAMNDRNRYGEADYSQLKIILSDTCGVNNLSDDRIQDCFYHEKVHLILDSIGERELSQNEKFVDLFSKLLRQSETTAEY